ncbi:hypothetical protein AB0M20_02510 [Actinoplanes sp. NPDC051633]|uniref:hypothetical protein n=1 Tax=Actinoplanes sp. NPDC051633 TaxID=3155670 RepID=UPI003428FDFB
MGRFSDDGGDRPNDGDQSNDLPELPEEWGVIVIPDDLSELADEVRAVRAELAVSAPQTRWERFRARPAVRRVRRIAGAGLRAPVLIISMALLVTVASLFASTWSGPSRSPATQRTANSTAAPTGRLPALDLLGSDGQIVALSAQLPAVILMVDGCSCAQLVKDALAAVRPEVAVVTVTSGRPSAGTAPPTGATPQAQGKTLRELRDPTGGLRDFLNLAAPDGTAAAVLVRRGGEIVRTETRAFSFDALSADLAKL